MAEKASQTAPAPRKRVLVSCDRCKLRRSRCIRSDTNEPCADCQSSGVECESKLPRKQRVYGSVETLSLRFRALEALVKGLLPSDNVQDTNVLFKIAAARQIPMPAQDDFTPCPFEIFDDQKKSQPNLSLQSHHQSHSMFGVHSKPMDTNPIPVMDVPTTQPAEKLIPTLNGVAHYFGPSSSFRLAMTLRGLVARFNALPDARVVFQNTNSARSDAANGSLGEASASALKRKDARISEGADSRDTKPSGGVISHKRSRPELSKQDTIVSESFSSLKTVGDLLPADADALIAAYFQHVHIRSPLFQQSIFQSQYEAIASRPEKRIQEDEDLGWLCCFTLVFAFGANALEKYGSSQARSMQNKCLYFVRTSLQYLITTTSLVNVQALALLTMWDQSVGKRNSSWVLLGAATRMALSMGMHREATSSEFDTAERANRRLVWYALYVMERMVCFILGRPSSIHDDEVTANPPDETTLGCHHPRGLLEEMVQLIKMAHHFRRRAYFQNGYPSERSPPISVVKALLQESSAFNKALPATLKPSCDFPQKQSVGLFLFRSLYHHTRCMITIDFLIRKVEMNILSLENRETAPPADYRDVRALSEECVNSAYASLKNLVAAGKVGVMNGTSWLDVFFIFHSVLVICVDFLARPTHQIDSPEDMERKAITREAFHLTRITNTVPKRSYLAQVATQLASIAGIIEEPYMPLQQSNLSVPNSQPVPCADPTINLTCVGESCVTQELSENEAGCVFWDYTSIPFRPGDMYQSGKFKRPRQ